MKIGMLFVLIAAGVVFAGAAQAQSYDLVSPVPSPLEPTSKASWSGDTHQDWPMWALDRPSEGISAMKAGDFASAEKAFARALRGKPNDAEINLYMGVTKMNLGRWEEAKHYLQVASSRDAKHPDPKSRLGVTYAKLGDKAGAYAQCVQLEQMALACRGACRMSSYIADGIRMIDQALAED